MAEFCIFARNSEADKAPGSAEESMRVLILDLKWSYGIEQITAILHDQLGKSCEVKVISAAESVLPYSTKIAKSLSYREMFVASLNPQVTISIVREIRRFRPDVLYFISPHVLNPVVAGYCRLFTRICVITHIHDPAHYGKKLVSRLVDSVSFVQAHLSHRIYCWGKTIRDTACARFHVSTSQFAVFRHGPGQETSCDKGNLEGCWESRCQFSMVGALEKRKGIEYFLKAAILFNREHGSDRAEFLLAGEGCLDEYLDLMEQITNLTVTNRFIPDDEVNRILLRSYALVLPYIGGVLQSSFIAIAYGNGCPVIVSDIGSLAEEVENGKTGYVVKKASVEEIAAAMARIYSESRRKVFSVNCIQSYRQKFNWGVIGIQMYCDMNGAVEELSKRPKREKVEPVRREAPKRGTA